MGRLLTIKHNYTLSKTKASLPLCIWAIVILPTCTLRVRSGYMRWENNTFLPISNFAVSSMGAWTKATPTSPQHHWSTQIGCPIPYECLFSSCGLQFYGNRKNWTQLWYWSVTPQCVRGWALNSLIVFSEPAVMKKTKLKKITKKAHGTHTGTRQYSN